MSYTFFYLFLCCIATEAEKKMSQFTSIFFSTAAPFVAAHTRLKHMSQVLTVEAGAAVAFKVYGMVMG